MLACDGIWDVMTNEEVVDFVRTRLIHKRVRGGAQSSVLYPEEVCEELMNHCLAPDALMGTGCDNMTVVVVCFLHGKPYSQFVLRCQRSSNIDPTIDSSN